MTKWDPIGVKGYINTEDEYDRYAMRVYSHLAAGWNAQQIAEYLADVEHTAIGLSPRPAANLITVAEHLLAEWERFIKTGATD